MGAVRFELIGKVDGVPRVVVEHITRTDAESDQDWENPPGGPRRLLPDQDHRRADDAGRLHPPRRARRPQRQRHDHHRPADHQRARRRSSPPKPGLVTAIDLPLVTGRGLVSTSEHPRQLRGPRPGRDRHRRRPRARRRHRRRARRGRRRRPHLGPDRRPARRGRRPGSRPWAAGRVVVPADLSDLDAVAGPGADGVRRARPDRHRRQQRRRHLPARLPRDQPAVPHRGVQLQRRHRARADPRRGAADAQEPRRPAVGRHHQLDDGPHRRPRVRRLRHGQGGARALDPAGRVRPGAEDPGQRHLRRLDHDQRPGVRRRPA